MEKTTYENDIDQIWDLLGMSKGILKEEQFFELLITLILIKFVILKKNMINLNTETQGSDVNFPNIPDDMRFKELYENIKEPYFLKNLCSFIERLKYDSFNQLEITQTFKYLQNLALKDDKRINSLVYRLMMTVDQIVNIKLLEAQKHETNIGTLFNIILTKYANYMSKKGDENFTPLEISKLMAKLVGPTEGEEIYDPVCGSSSLLIRVAKEIQGNRFSLYGQEINIRTAAISKINMILNGMDSVSNIAQGDTLRNPMFHDGETLKKFDLVVTNPPFAVSNWGYEEAHHDPYNRYMRGIPPKRNGDYAFILHAIESLNKDINKQSRLCIVTSNGVLFRGGAEGKIRENLIKENLLDAVIALPANLFYGTGISCSILIFKTNKKDKKVLFIDASEMCHKKDRIKNRLGEEHIFQILDIYTEYKSLDSISYVADYSEIKENDFNLTVSRYITFVQEEEIDLKVEMDEIEIIEKKILAIQKEMHKSLKNFK
ncbi:MAG: SAM-dependent methyltransferase [Clostridia bacterium]|nr:SAM-dependent methyltransferase [Clostridia bacterium]